MEGIKLKDAIQTLMDSAVRDVTGSGMGYRTTTDEWREKVSLAWERCFQYVNGRKPDYSDYFNSNMSRCSQEQINEKNN